MKIHETIFVVAGTKRISDDCTVVRLGQSWEKRSKSGNQTQWLNLSWYINGEASKAAAEIAPGTQIKMPSGSMIVPDNYTYQDQESGENRTFYQMKILPPRLTEETKDDSTARVEIVQNAAEARSLDQNVPF